MSQDNSFMLILLLLTSGSLAIEIGMGILTELGSFPLKENPFFAKVVALGGNFNTDATIDESADSTGYDCQMLGDFECNEEDLPKCSGRDF